METDTNDITVMGRKTPMEKGVGQARKLMKAKGSESGELFRDLVYSPGMLKFWCEDPDSQPDSSLGTCVALDGSLVSCCGPQFTHL